MGVNLETLRPEPTVEGFTTPGGYSCKAVRPIALRMVMEIATDDSDANFPDAVSRASAESKAAAMPRNSSCSARTRRRSAPA